MIDEALATLPPGQRAVVDLRDVQQLDGDEVCNILGLSETNHRNPNCVCASSRKGFDDSGAV